MYRIWSNRPHLQPETETDDTCDENDVGGLGKYSHKDTGLIHQYYVEQVVSAGCFNVHCTESAEAKHKTCMRLPAKRVRHGRQNDTHASMTAYMCRRELFRSIQISHMPDPDKRTRCPPKPGVRLPLSQSTRWGPQMVTMNVDLTSPDAQRLFLHPGARIARVELLDLVCGVLGMAKSVASYRALQRLSWVLGQKLCSPSGITYWSTDSEYNVFRNSAGQARRDCLLLSGTENIPVTLPNGHVVTRRTALCCQAVCFITLGNLSLLPHHAIPARLQSEVNEGS